MLSTALIALIEAGGEALGEAILQEITHEGVVEIPLNSRAIQSASYAIDGTASVTFTDGSVYSWPHGRLPLTVFQGLITADSPGKFFNSQMRGRY